MKTNKLILPLAFAAVLFSGCTKDDDYEVHGLTPMIFAEDFSEGAVDNTVLDTPNWINYAEAGTMLWKEQVYSGDAYAEFSSYNPSAPEPVNIGWLISPAINMDEHEGEKLQFRSSQSYVSSAANSLEVLVSTDFDGTNVLGATWEPLDVTLPTPSSTYFEYVKSGIVDLSGYTGNIHIAFRVKGSGTNSQLDGGYQIDTVRITY